MVKQPGHLTSMKNEFGDCTSLFNLCFLASTAGSGCSRSHSRAYGGTRESESANDKIAKASNNSGRQTRGNPERNAWKSESSKQVGRDGVGAAPPQRARTPPNVISQGSDHRVSDTKPSTLERGSGGASARQRRRRQIAMPTTARKPTTIGILKLATSRKHDNPAHADAIEPHIPTTIRDGAK